MGDRWWAEEEEEDAEEGGWGKRKDWFWRKKGDGRGAACSCRTIPRSPTKIKLTERVHIRKNLPVGGNHGKIMEGGMNIEQCV